MDGRCLRGLRRVISWIGEEGRREGGREGGEKVEDLTGRTRTEIRQFPSLLSPSIILSPSPPSPPSLPLFPNRIFCAIGTPTKGIYPGIVELPKLPKVNHLLSLPPSLSPPLPLRPNRIFRALGTPTEATSTGIVELPEFQKVTTQFPRYLS